MIRILTTAAVAALLAGSASAAQVTVHTAGKDAATVQHDISRAARQVCSEALMDEPLAFYLMPGCVKDAKERAAAALPTVTAQAAQGQDAAAITR